MHPLHCPSTLTHLPCTYSKEGIKEQRKTMVMMYCTVFVLGLPFENAEGQPKKVQGIWLWHWRIDRSERSARAAQRAKKRTWGIEGTAIPEEKERKGKRGELKETACARAEQRTRYEHESFKCQIFQTIGLTLTRQTAGGGRQWRVAVGTRTTCPRGAISSKRANDHSGPSFVAHSPCTRQNAPWRKQV
jgi:hypothetical protein